MTTDKKETSRATKRTARTSTASKRPARTIDLEAEEVEKSEAAAQKETFGEQDVKSAEDKKQADAVAKKEKVAKADSKKDAADDPADQSTTLPPPRTTPSEIKGLVTHLAAGLVGGLIGVVAAGIGMSQFSSGGPEATAQSVPQIAELEARVKALKSELDEQSKALKTSAASDGMNKLEARVSAIEKKASTAPANANTEISDRITKLESTLKSLQTAAGSAKGNAALAEFASRLDALSAELDKRASALNAELAKLKTSLPGSGTDTKSQAATDALTERTKTLEAQLAKLSGEVKATEKAQTTSHDAGQGAALALAFEGVRRAVSSGEPFADQLALFEKFAPENLDLSALSAYAKTGVPRRRALLEELPALLEKAEESVPKSADDSFFDRLVSNAQAIVRVRRIGPAQGQDATAVLSRMESEMKASDLAGVLREAENLKGHALQVIKPWIEKAKIRQSAITALDSVETELLTSHEPGSNAAAQR